MIRHGESYANADGLAGGPIGDGGLTPLGRRQAEALVARLVMSAELSKASAFYTSALPRAIETGEILRAALPSLEPVVDADLNEISVGEGDGLPWAQYVERYGAPDWDLEPNALTAPGGESLLGFYERCRAAIERPGRGPSSPVGGAGESRRLHRAGHEDLPGRRAPGSPATAHRELLDDRDRVSRGLATTPSLQRPRAVAGRVTLQELGDVKGHVEALGGVQSRVTDRGVVELQVALVEA